MEYYFKRYSQNHSEINKVPEDEGMISAKKKKNISRNLTKFQGNRQTTTKYITIYFRDPKVKLLFHNKQANQNSMRIIITKTALDTTNSTFKCISYIKWNQLKSKFYKQVKQFYIK